MNANEFIDFGFYLVEKLTEANKFYYKSAEYDNAAIGVSFFQDKVKHIQSLLNNHEILQKIEDSGLLKNTKIILASTDERVSQFEAILALCFDLADYKHDWQTHFETNLDWYVDVWEYPERWEISVKKRELQQIAEAEIEAKLDKKLFADNLIFAKENLENPPRQAPCFFETRKNGLNCNSGELVSIKEFATVTLNNCEYKISIKKCRQCWQIYKEFIWFDKLNQVRSKYLKPNESNVEYGFGFSTAEAVEYNKIDFKSFFNPNLKKM